MLLALADNTTKEKALLQMPIMIPYYNPNDWYWYIGTDTSKLWSSKRMTYVTPSDPDYQNWQALLGVIILISPDTVSLCSAMQQQALPGFLMTMNIQIISNSNPDMNATYGLDPVTLNQIGVVARDVASGIGLPLESTTFQYPSLDGTLKTMSPTDIVNLYKAMRDLVAQISYAVPARIMGADMPFPSNIVNIP